MVIDCTLSNLTIPGFPELEPDFGSKKEDGQPVSSREADVNIRMPFTRQRPYSVLETSTTSVIEAHSTFSIGIAGITLTLGEGGFIGCAARVINTASGNAVFSGTGMDSTVTLEPGEARSLFWSGSAWILESSDNHVENDLINETAAREEGDAELAARLNAVEGRGGPVAAHDFGSEAPTQAAVTQYACEAIWGLRRRVRVEYRHSRRVNVCGGRSNAYGKRYI
jgi:hypothetical protein